MNISRRTFLAAWAAAPPQNDKPLRGIFIILATPFTEAQAVDYADLAREVEFLSRCGVHGLGFRPPEKVRIKQPADEGHWIWRLGDALCGVQFREFPVWTCFPLAEAFFRRNSSRLATSEPVWSVSECCGGLGVQPSPRGFS